jgi:hypothetical protein
MKQCPQCNSVYPEDSLRFCGRDGSPLVDLSQTAAGFASLPISPSEIVLLHGEQFAPQGGGSFNTSVDVPLSGLAVGARELALMTLSAMVLGCEQAGSAYLQPGQKGGLSSSDILFVSQGPMNNVHWQEWSLEYRFCGILNQGVQRRLSHVVTQLWQGDFKRRIAGGWIHARTLVLQGLAARNLISAPPDFSVVQVEPMLVNLPAEETTEPIKQLFSETSGQRRQIWAALQAEIEAGINQRAKA